MNNCNFIGNLGKDAELKELEGGKKVINFDIAVADGKDRPPLWVSCAKWSEKTGVLPYLKKGTKVGVSGTVGIRKWEGGATITLRVLDLELLDSKKDEHPGVDAASYNQSNKEPHTLGAEPPDDLPF